MQKLNVVPRAQLVFGLAIAIAFSAPVLAASDANAPLTKQEVKTLIKTAKTPEDHMKLARYYSYEAGKLKSEAKDHQEMGEEYYENPSAHPSPKWPTFGEHCRDLSAYYAKAADKAEQLAKLQEAMAKDADVGK